MLSARLRVDVKTDVRVMYRIGVWRRLNRSNRSARKVKAEENLFRVRLLMKERPRTGRPLRVKGDITAL